MKIPTKRPSKIHRKAFLYSLIRELPPVTDIAIHIAFNSLDPVKMVILALFFAFLPRIGYEDNTTLS